MIQDAMPRGGKRPGAGRPKRYRVPMTRILVLRLTPGQLEVIERAAKHSALSVQEWAREMLVKAAE